MHSLGCVHCDTVVALEIRRVAAGTILIDHLVNVHGNLVAIDEVVRWDGLLEHYRVVAPRYPSMPRLLEG
jgi:hypothetical protein